MANNEDKKKIIQCVKCFNLDFGKGFGVSSLPGDMDHCYGAPLVYLPDDCKVVCSSCSESNSSDLKKGVGYG